MGPRPIDLHLKALRKLGVSIEDSRGFLECKANHLQGNVICLDFPSVGATENAVLASVKAKGFTEIYNAAREPEIYNLQCFLNKMGARISGAGSSVIRVEGVSELSGTTFSVMPDRIVAATYLCIAAMTEGSVRVTNLPDFPYMESVFSVLTDIGCRTERNGTVSCLFRPQRMRPLDILRTMPYPGFPTDAQAPVFTLLTVADGTSTVIENIFENRFKHAEELCRMGADIVINGRLAVIRGVDSLHGTQVACPDLRGAAALLIASLGAEGDSVLEDIYHLDRGYERIDEVLNAVGLKSKRLD